MAKAGRYGLVTMSLVGALSLACGSVAQGVKEGVVKATFCDELPNHFGSNTEAFVDPRDLLSCMHPSGNVKGSTVTTTLTACSDLENWALTQTVTISWAGLFKSYRTQIQTDYRVVGGYVSTRTTKVFDEAAIESEGRCTDGQWRQSDQKVMDTTAIVNGR